MTTLRLLSYLLRAWLGGIAATGAYEALLDGRSNAAGLWTAGAVVLAALIAIDAVADHQRGRIQ